MILFLGALFLVGRFPWGGNHEFALRNYVVSGFFFVTFYATWCFVLKELVRDTLLRRSLSGVVFLTFTVPHHLFGLDKYYYHLTHKAMTDWRSPDLPLSQIFWFPSAFLHPPSIPYELLFFSGIFIIGGLLIWSLTQAATKVLSRRLCLIVWALILLQTWLHLSMRSPYTYLPHFEQPAANGYWYHYFLFPEGMGAVNLDYHHFRPAEELFLGFDQTVSPLLSRTFPAYLVSHFAAFVHPYYVWLTLNCIVWFLATLSIGYLANALFSKQAAMFASLLMASAQGVIVYVAQAKPYATAIGGIAILVALLHWFFSRSEMTRRQCVGVGGVFGLFLLCYEAQPWLIVIPLLGRSMGVPWKKSLLIVLTGLAISQAFIGLSSAGLLMPHQNALPPGAKPLHVIMDLLRQGSIIRLYRRTIDTIYGYSDSLLHAFQLTALLGLPMVLLIRDKRTRCFLGCLFLPGFLTFWMFQLALSFYTEFPRLVYSAYPALYVLGGAALAAMAARTASAIQSRLKAALVWGIVAANFVYLNLDVWGFPLIYYRWFYRSQLFFAS